MIGTQRSWTDASAVCVANGMQLVSIETPEENAYIAIDLTNHGGFRSRKLLRNLNLTTYFICGDFDFLGFPAIDGSHNLFWTSGSDAEFDGEWIWTATGLPITYFSWYGSSPDGRPGEDYLYINCNLPGKWDDWRDDDFFETFTACEASI